VVGLAASTALAGDGNDNATAEDTPTEPRDGQLLMCPPGGPPLSTYDGIPRVSSTLFVNFDGATMSSGMDDAPSNTTQISQCVGSFAAYGGGSKQDAAFQAVQAHYEPFDLPLVNTRPGGNDYCMVMTGPTNPFGGGVLGISPLDCGDQNPKSISFSFVSANDPYSASLQGTVIAHEVAHAFGLDHVNDPGDVMNPSVSEQTMVFKDQCISTAQGSCPSHPGCSQGQQNDYAELMQLFGPSQPDAGPPTVEITYPNDGDTFDVGASFTLTVEATDDRGVVQVDLYNNGTQQSSDNTEPWGWDIDNIPEGTYAFHVIAIDEAGNEATSDTVTIEVGAAGGDGGDGDDGSGDDGGDDGGGDDGADDGGEPYDPGDGGDLPPGYGDEEGDEGCGCGTSPGTGSLGLLLLFGLPLVRRRRS